MRSCGSVTDTVKQHWQQMWWQTGDGNRASVSSGSSHKSGRLDSVPPGEGKGWGHAGGPVPRTNPRRRVGNSAERAMRPWRGIRTLFSTGSLTGNGEPVKIFRRCRTWMDLYVKGAILRAEWMRTAGRSVRSLLHQTRQMHTQTWQASAEESLQPGSCQWTGVTVPAGHSGFKTAGAMESFEVHQTQALQPLATAQTGRELKAGHSWDKEKNRRKGQKLEKCVERNRWLPRQLVPITTWVRWGPCAAAAQPSLNPDRLLHTVSMRRVSCFSNK